MRCFLPVLMALLLGGSVRALELTTMKGRVYRGVEVLEVSAEGVSIRHESGLGRVPFEELPPAWLTAQKIERPVVPVPVPAAGETEEEEDLTKRDAGRCVLPLSGPGVNLTLDSRGRRERELRELMELRQHSAEEIERMLAERPIQPGIGVSWTRAKYEEASSKRFEMIVSTEGGVALQRVEPEFSAPVEKEAGWVNAAYFTVKEGVPRRFKVRVLEGWQFWDFLVDEDGLTLGDTKAYDEEARKLEEFERRKEKLLDGRPFVIPE